MRLQLLGTYSLEEFETAISSILQDFKSSNIDSRRHINIYAQPCVKGRMTQLMDGEDEVEHMVYRLPHKTKVELTSESLKIVPPYKAAVKPDEN